MEPPEEYLQKTSLRAMLASLLERTCKDKPDNLVPFMLEYMQYTYPAEAEAAKPANPPGDFGSWTKRADVQPTQEGLQAYLQEIKARPTLEGILEQALRKQPANVVAFVIESLCDGDSAAAAPTGSASAGDAVSDVYGIVAKRETAHERAPELMEAVGDGDVEKIEELLAAGVPTDSENEELSTPLILAAEGEPAIISLLLEKGCSVDHQNKEGKTALIAAVLYEDPEIVGLLLAAGAKQDLTDVSGMSAVDYAKKGGDNAILAHFGLEGEPEPPPPEPAAAGKPRRNSVSSESIDPKAKVDTSKIKVVPKDDATKERIKTAVMSSILFKSLDKEQLDAVIMSLEEVSVADKEAIITQGDEGNHFYIVDSGSFDCFVQVKKPDDGLEAPGRKVLDYTPGMTFGELALMYNTPRAASVVATSAAVLWAMDRETFRTILLQMMCQKRMRFEALLETVPLLRSMESYERTAVADAFEEKTYAEGEVILSEGDAGDTFYLLCKGAAMATKKGDAGRKQVLEYKEGDYFGELALLNAAPRAASVEARTDCTCVHLDRSSFERLLGPVIHILKRNAENYKAYADGLALE